MNEDELRARFKIEADRIETAVRTAMRPPSLGSMSAHECVIHHRAAVLALTAVLGDLFLTIPDPHVREQVRGGALAVLAPIPSQQELH